MIEQKESFKDRYIQALNESELSAADISRLTGISESTLSQYKTGYAATKRDKLQKISNALSVSPSWLMGLESDKKEKPFELEEEKREVLSDIEYQIIMAFRKEDDVGKEAILRFLRLDDASKLLQWQQKYLYEQSKSG